MPTDKNTTELKKGISLIIETTSYGTCSAGLLEELSEKITCFVKDKANTRPEPTLKSSEGLLDQIEVFIQKHYCREVVGSCRDVAKEILSTITPTTETASEGEK